MSYQNDQKVIPTTAPELCIKCKQMYGHQTFANMCSKCFKSQKLQTIQSELLLKKNNPNQSLQKITLNTFPELKQKSEKIEEKGQLKLSTRKNNQNAQNKSERERTRQKQQKKPQNKWFNCNKKTGILGYECKHCINNFCKFHRLPEDHQCRVDFISAGKKQLTAANPELKARKISGMDN